MKEEEGIGKEPGKGRGGGRGATYWTVVSVMELTLFCTP